MRAAAGTRTPGTWTPGRTSTCQHQRLHAQAHFRRLPAQALAVGHCSVKQKDLSIHLPWETKAVSPAVRKCSRDVVPPECCYFGYSGAERGYASASVCSICWFALPGATMKRYSYTTTSQAQHQNILRSLPPSLWKPVFPARPEGVEKIVRE